MSVDQLVVGYADPARVKQDVRSLQLQVPTLVPRQSSLIANDGTEQRLLSLLGTVPITHQGSQYNIPVEMYVTKGYPRTAPICYVRPTLMMSVKPGHRHVDAEGLVYLPYLHEWGQHTHTLVALCATMVSIFGPDPPVFAKPKAPVQQPPPPAYSDVASPGRSPAEPAAASDRRPGAAATPAAGSGGGAETPKKAAVREVTRRLQHELKGFYGSCAAEVDQEYGKQSKLKAGDAELTESLELLKAHKMRLDEQFKVCAASSTELDTWLQRRREEEQLTIDPDDLVQPTDPCSQKMVALVAEAGALEDALFALDRGLIKGVVDLDQFLREVRRISNQQFICLTHIKKILRVQRP